MNTTRRILPLPTRYNLRRRSPIVKTALNVVVFIAIGLCCAFADQAQKPKELFLASGGFFGPNYRVFWQEEKLFYGVSAKSGAKETLTTLEPTLDQWTSFRKALDELGVWSWRKKYERNVLDGTQWSISIQYEGRRVASSGSNDYPRDYAEFLTAVQKLLGGRAFH